MHNQLSIYHLNCSIRCAKYRNTQVRFNASHERNHNIFTSIVKDFSSTVFDAILNFCMQRFLFWAPHHAFRCKSSSKIAVAAQLARSFWCRSCQLASTGVLASGLSAAIAGAGHSGTTSKPESQHMGEKRKAYSNTDLVPCVNSSI